MIKLFCRYAPIFVLSFIFVFNTQAASLTYGGAGFIESSSNDGTVTGSITATLNGDAFSGNTLAVGVDVTLGNLPAGLTPAINVTPGGSDWTSLAATENSSWASITYGNGLFVAVSQGGTNQIMTSPDGINWTPRTQSENVNWASVAFGNGIFVAVSPSGANHIMTSPDGINWTTRTAPESNSWNSVTFGGGQFVAVATSGANRVMTSPDGINWTARAAAEANNWLSVTYGGGVYVAVANTGVNRVMSSPDGITWTAHPATEANTWISVTYGNGLFVAVSYDGTNRVMTSPDGSTWTARTAAENNLWGGITYGSGLFVAVAFGGTNRVMTSPDGINWTSQSASENLQWNTVGFGNDLFVALADSGANRIMTASADSVATLTLTGNANNHEDLNDVADITFDFADSAFSVGPANTITNATGPASSNLGVDFENHASLTYGGSGFDEPDANDSSVTGSIIATLAGDSFAKNSLTPGADVTLGNIPAGLIPTVNTVNGASDWTARSAAEDNAWYDIVYGGGQFVAVSTSGANRVMTSPDGINWTAHAAAEDNAWFSLAYGAGLFVAVAGNGANRIMTSPDGINWTPRAATVDVLWRSIVYGGGQFVAVSFGDDVMTSPDGITWTARTAASDTNWTAITYGDGVYVAVAVSGAIMTSPDGITWTTRAAPAANLWTAATYGNGLFIILAEAGDPDRVATSPDGITWTAQTAAENNAWAYLTYGNGLYVAVARNGTNRVMTSPDGINWTAQAATADNAWYAVIHQDNQFIAVAQSGTERVMTASSEATATLTLSGNATSSEPADNVTNITFAFADAAFAIGPANTVTNATGPASSNRGVTFVSAAESGGGSGVVGAGTGVLKLCDHNTGQSISAYPSASNGNAYRNFTECQITQGYYTKACVDNWLTEMNYSRSTGNCAAQVIAEETTKAAPENIAESHSNNVFPDVPASHPFAEAIAWLKDNGLVEGYDDGSFKPDQTLNRAEFLKIVIEASDIDPQLACRRAYDYEDVDWSAWYGQYLQVASCQGIVQGYPDQTFKPSNPINFVEAAKITLMTLGTVVDTDALIWYQPYTDKLESLDAIPSTISTNEHALTRGEMAYMIWRIQGNQ